MRETVAIAAELLQVIEADVDLYGTVRRADRSTCVVEGGLGSGPWGASLAYTELSRHVVDQSEVLRAISIRLAGNNGPAADGLGTFSGTAGAALACAALGQRQEVHGGQGERLTGDLMDGWASVEWARACLGNRPSPVAHDPDGGYEDAPGMAHGVLGISSLNALSDSGPEAASGSAGNGLSGWCNGSSGLAAALVIRWKKSGDVADATAALLAARSSLDASHDTDGLCHGRAGAIAVAAGVARLLGDEDLSIQALRSAYSLAARLHRSPMRLSAGVHLDQTWLTGVAGAAWGLLVATKRPMVNPLLPLDSELTTGMR